MTDHGMTRRGIVGAVVAGALLPRRARAQARPLRIGVLTDLSGQYRDTGGATSVICAQQAVQDFGTTRGLQIEVLSADHQQKPDIASAIVRRWFDRDGVDAVCEVNNSAIAYAVTDIAQATNKVHLNTGAVSADLTGARCSPNLVHWEEDTWQIARTMGTAVAKQGGDRWYFVTADYAFGTAMQRDISQFVEAAGGRVVGASRYPFPGTTDFSSYLLQAREFGLAQKGLRVVGLVVFTTDIKAIGLDIAQGLVLTEGFYWDLNARTRAFTDRVRPKTPDNWPNQEHASCYAAVLHYLKAVEAMGVAAAQASGAAAVATMKRMPTDDDAFGPGRIREDGRHLHPVHLFQVKAPSESRGPWDFYKLLDTIPGEEAFRPLAAGGCAFLKT